MMKTSFTFYSKFSRPLFLVLSVMFLSWSTTSAQCSLGCNNSIQVSLDNDNCEATITPNDLLTDATTCPGGSFIVELRHNGALLPSSPTLTQNEVGKTIEAKVIDTDSGNSCWGWITVEDKLAPVIECNNPGNLFCYEVDTYQPTVFENCGTYTLYTLDSVEQLNNCDGTMPVNVLKRITKSYKAVDASGNESEVCDITFDILKIDDLNIITPPISYLYPTNNLLCNADFKTDVNGNPHPDVTGYPQLNGHDLRPDDILQCNLLVEYSDDIVKDIQCVRKVIRTWTILEWSCENNPPRQIIQMIEIADTNAPIITGAQDITVSTTPHHCDALATIPAVGVYDSCSAVTVTISGGTPLIVGNGGVTSLPVGVNPVTYVATDACGNSTTATINVTVEDLTPPVAVCDQNTTVSVTTDGTAWVHASVFDDGSHDECALDQMLVRRMDNDNCDCELPSYKGFNYLGEYNGHYYYMTADSVTGKKAFKLANAMGNYVAVINDQAENDWIFNNFVKDTENVIIGYTDYQHEGNFKWIGDDSDYENWRLGQPDNKPLNPTGTGADYTVMRSKDGFWEDRALLNITSSAKRRFIMEVDDRCAFSSYVKFCCEDIADEDQMVVFRVVDKACNYNECMVNTEVQDKLPPSIVCPQDLYIECDEYYPTGDLVADFGDYQYYDNCEKPVISDSITYEDVNQCNVGELVRTITATDKGGRSATCQQRIEIEPDYYNLTQIRFPADVTMNTCADPADDAFSPDNLGRPEFVGENQCHLFGADYEDKVFTFNNSNGEACFKIIRRWYIIDWCSHSHGTHYIDEYDQVIKVNDTEGPELTSSCDPKSTCTYDASCNDGFIELTATATDECTDVLDYFWKVDLNNDGSFDLGLYNGQPLSGNGKANMINASGVYPVGTHLIQYTFADKCGNVVTCDQEFSIVNCKAPTPYCLNGLAVDLMPVTDNQGEIIGGMVELWASDFDAGSFHTCPEYNVYVSFSENLLDTGRVFTCDDFGRADVMIWASVITPMGDTLRSFCNTFVDVQDNMEACDEQRVGIFGNIQTYNNENLVGARVTLQGIEEDVVISDDEGAYTFGQMPVGGDYVVIPSKNDDHLNGVSTLDLVLMQRHILNIAEFDAPAKYIAADINNDAKITSSDLVELRKLILGVTNEFEKNESWKFIDANFNFANDANPLVEGFEEKYAITALNADMDIDFNSVKVGDINGDAKANVNAGISTENRSLDQLNLTTANVAFDKEDEVSVVISTSEVATIFGTQFTIEFDASSLTFNSINGLDIDADQSNIGLTRINEGVITFSWAGTNAVDVNELLEINFTAKERGDVKSVITVSSLITEAEAYNNNLEVMDLTFRTQETETGLALYQNTPNPFNNTTTIAFNMPNKAMATLTILDVTGKTIYNMTSEFDAGINSITVDKVEHNLSGVLYYQLTVNDETLVKKMVVME